VTQTEEILSKAHSQIAQIESHLTFLESQTPLSDVLDIIPETIQIPLKEQIAPEVGTKATTFRIITSVYEHDDLGKAQDHADWILDPKIAHIPITVYHVCFLITSLKLPE